MNNQYHGPTAYELSISGPADALQASDREALQSALSSVEETDRSPIRALLRFGVDRLDADTGFLTRIRPGPGTHTITDVVNPSALKEGDTQNLARTYCRRVVSHGGAVAVPDAARKEWIDDPTNHSFPFDCYLGTKVLVNNQLFGTVAFAASDARSEPFADAEQALAQHIASHVGAVLTAHSERASSFETDASADLLRRIQEASDIGGWELDLVTEDVTWTRETYLIHEVPLDYEPELNAFGAFLPEDARNTFRSALRRCWDDGTPFDLELPLDTAQGRRRWTRWHGEPQYENGEITRLVGTTQDITETREMEQDHRRAQARLTALFEQTPVMINVHDDDGNLLDPNPRLCKETGYDEDELTDMKVWELDQSLDPEQAHALWQEMNVGDRRQLEGEYRRRDGSTFPVEVHVRRLDLDGGSQFMAMARNVTDRKKEERRRKQIISRVTDAILEVDADWRFTLVSEQAEALTGMKESDLVGERFWDVFPEVRDTYLEDEYRRVMNAREPTRLVEYYSGLDSWFDIQVYANDDGGLAFYFDDVTERKERERRLDAVFNHTYQFTGLMAPDGTLLEVNDTALAFGGVDEADVLGKPLWEAHWAQTGEESKQRLREEIDRAASGEFVRYERPIKGREGEQRIVDFSIRPVRDERGEVTLLIPEARDITDRKKREAALREDRNLLDRVFQTSPTAITIANAQGEMTRANDQAQEVLGLEHDEITSRTFKDPDWKITAPDGGPFPEEELPFAQVRRTGEPVFGVEHAIEWPDGTRRLLSINGAPLHDPDGTFSGAVFHLDDITEQRNTQRKLRRSEHRFRGIFENAALGIALMHEDGTLLEANPTLERMLGYQPGKLQGTHFRTVIHPDDVAADARLYEELAAGERDQYQIEKRYVSKNGEPFWGRLTMSRTEGPEESLILGMIEDIDVQKQRQEELRLFQKMVEHSSDAITLMEGTVPEDRVSELLYVNPAFEELTGYDSEEAVGQTVEFLHGPQTQRWAVDRAFEQLRAGQSVETETINYRKDGTPFVKRWSMVPIRNAEDEITHFVSVERDITDRRRTQERLLEVQEEERRRIDQRIHDEMGGFLTTLQMTVELARRQHEQPPEQLDEIETLVEELSTTARSISRRLYPSSLAENGLSDALPDLAETMTKHHDLNVEVTIDLDDEQQISSLVERTVFWVAYEALTNVVKHAETDAATVVLDETDRELQLQVVDEGQGFDSETQHPDDSLGLAGIRHRIERLSGTVSIETALGEGTHLSITLPLPISPVPR